MPDVPLTPITRPFNATIAPPGSKSLSNRALILAALANGTSELSNMLFADDTLVMLDGLQALGFNLEIDRDAKIVKVHGQSGAIPNPSAQLFCGNSGTTIRFLAALCSLGKGEYTLDGVARMQQRPIGELVGLLQNLGARIEYSGQEGFPPIKILADGLAGGLLHYPTSVSSQFLSAVLMVSPHARHEVRVDLEPRQTSWPYVAMTMQLMDVFHHTVELIRDPNTDEPKQIIVPLGAYSGTAYAIEPDASNAAYFLAIAAVHPESSVTITGLGSSSLQGDVGLAKVLQQMGATVDIEKTSITVTGPAKLAGIDVNLLDMPDQAQTLAVVAMFAQGTTTLRGLHTLRVKETDRLAALCNELQKFGAAIEIQGEDTLIVYPPQDLHAATVDTYDDHRMAMSFAIAGTKLPGVIIREAQCVNKTYPEFFQDLTQLSEAKKG